ncbi:MULTISPECIES: right-handed parallel beta-helix repeat-containing protein [Streptacidiphilus]|uniref:Right-handed parallel beta-helix repeat-containing protein n=2 Tax=Streptacidiphilus TaxID=228398 RepID=A0ABV6UNR3_9ACTN|nr:right-handed parallel beta-helix repeat-containing protein [Streptacidiphilus jeojiense]
MRRKRIAPPAALLIGAALALPALTGTGTADAATGTLYVNNAAGAHCSDKGTGTQAVPYCTVVAAAAAVQPGQTVLVSSGTYPQELDITRSGTATAPITFKGLPGEYGGDSSLPQIGDASDPSTSTLHGILVKGAQHVVIDGFSPVGQYDSIGVTGGSQNVTVERSVLTTTGIAVSGSSGTVVTTNVLRNIEYAGVSVTKSPGTVVTGNTVTSWCESGIQFDGASPNGVVENNIVDSAALGSPGDAACPAGSQDTEVLVPTGSTTGTKVAYNFLGTKSGGPAYQWGAKTYTSAAAFAAASGQGSHDVLGDTGAVGDSSQNTVAVDSADAGAPGELSTDILGNPRVDVRSVPNTGTGVGYYDRGAEETSTGNSYAPMSPVRVLDTRSAVGVSTTTPVAAGKSVTLDLSGTHRIPAGAEAVALNVTATGGSTNGTLKVTPTHPYDGGGDQVPIDQIKAVNLTWSRGENVANMVTVPAGRDTVTFTNTGSGTVHIVADLEGYFSQTAPNGYNTTGPVRILDTRAAKGVPGTAPIGSGRTVALPVTGSNGVPANATAVVLNVTVTRPTTGGYLTVYPDGIARPVVSNLNFSAGQTVPNLVIVPVHNGKIDFYNYSGSTHVIADLQGYFSPGGLSTFDLSTPQRILDTVAQSGVPTGPTPLAAGASLTVDINDMLGFGGLDTKSIALNLTVLDTTGSGYLTVYPYGSAQPFVSNANWNAGQSVSNLTLVPAKTGKVVITNHSTGSIDLLGDFEGASINF